MNQRRKRLNKLQKDLDSGDLEKETTRADERVQEQLAGKRKSRTQDMPPEVMGATRKDLAPGFDTHGTPPVISTIPKTPQECLLQAQTYLMSMNPTTGDPRLGLHNDILQGLSIAREELSQRKTPRVAVPIVPSKIDKTA